MRHTAFIMLTLGAVALAAPARAEPDAAYVTMVLQAFAAKTRTPLPMTGQVVEIHRLLVASGLGSKDSAEMMRLLDGFDKWPD